MDDYKEKDPEALETAREPVQNQQVDLERLGEENGYVVDPELLRSVGAQYQDIKLAKDGRTVLIPQPSNSPSVWSFISVERHRCSLFAGSPQLELDEEALDTLHYFRNRFSARLWQCNGCCYTDSASYDMAYERRHRQPLAGWQCLHARCRRRLRRRSLCVLRSTTDSLLVHPHSIVDGSMVCGCYDVSELHGCQNPERLLQHSRAGGTLDNVLGF